MRSLTIRIFVSFWLIIMVTIATTAVLGYTYAERARAATQNFEVSDAMLEASAALRENGHEGLSDWLRSLPSVTASMVYVLDDNGEDVLGRSLPAPIVLAMRRFGEARFRRPPPMRDMRNLRPARPFTQMVGPDERVYTLFVLPPQGVVGRWMAQRGGIGIVIIAVIISAAVSWFLARAISQPVRRLRESAVAIADGNLDTRVAERVARRRDEIGLLAQDFDRMAGELQQAWLRQTELSRNVSHELRSPLARLRVALELARRKTGDLPELDKIDTETERLDELIGQILEYSRLDAGPHEERADVDLVELLRSVAEDVGYEYGEDASIDVRADSTCTVEAYPRALRSAAENVLRNAMQHNVANGNVVIDVAVENADAVITVQDDGGGVPEAELLSIFEPFFRSAGGDDSRSRGTGLGLAIASRAIAMNGGSITARNAAGGLCVEIRLPAENQQVLFSSR